MGKKEKVGIAPVRENELPPEFKKFDKPFGLEQHVFNFLTLGIIGHAGFFYYMFYLLPFGHISWGTILLALVYGYMSGLGTTTGSHRYWTHRTFKAKKPLQYLMMFMQTAALQYPIFKWCRDHRVHHKYTDTDADPHNSKRGFWFSHITWLFLPKHPEVEEKLKIIDISDLINDPVVRFQSKYYWELSFLIFCVIPMSLCQWIFPETTLVQNFAWNMTRLVVALHITFLVNSAAHLWGDKPYDKYITSTDNTWVSILAVGEGWHNYHHTFPWDYKSNEFGFNFNFSTLLIHFFAKIGWAYDLKTVSHKVLVDRINRTGDGSHKLAKKDGDGGAKKSVEMTNDYKEKTCWGWGDDAMREEDVIVTEILFPSKNLRGER